MIPVSATLCRTVSVGIVRSSFNSWRNTPKVYRNFHIPAFCTSCVGRQSDILQTRADVVSSKAVQTILNYSFGYSESTWVTNNSVPASWIFIWTGYSPEVWGNSVESRVEALVGNLSWSSLQTFFTDFDCRNDYNLKILHNSPPDLWPVCFTVGVGWS